MNNLSYLCACVALLSFASEIVGEVAQAPEVQALSPKPSQKKSKKAQRAEKKNSKKATWYHGKKVKTAAAAVTPEQLIAQAEDRAREMKEALHIEQARAKLLNDRLASVTTRCHEAEQRMQIAENKLQQEELLAAQAAHSLQVTTAIDPDNVIEVQQSLIKNLEEEADAVKEKLQKARPYNQ